MQIAQQIKTLSELRHKGPVWFIEHFLQFKGKPFRLYKFQRSIAENIDFLREKIAIRKGRQVGGSLLVAALIVYYAISLPFLTAIIVSKTKDQASLISAYVRQFIQTSALKDLVDPKRTTVLDLHLLNQSKVITRSAGMVKGDTLRGHSVQGNGFLVFDESAFISGDAIRNTYYSAAGNCGIIHVSTPYRPVGAFYDACNSPRFKQFHIPCKVSPRITSDDIAFWRDDMPASKFANEVLADFSQGEDAVFAPELIDAAIDDNLPLWPGPFQGDKDKTYVYSLDPSRIGCDKWALTIGNLQDGTLSIEANHAWVGTQNESDYCDLTDNPETILNDILKYHKQRDFHCTKFYVDQTTNEYFGWRLQNKYLLPVESVIWSASKKEKLISHLHTVLQTGRLKIPNADAIRRELLSYAFDWQRMKDYEERKLYLSGEDDWVSSLAMISQAISVKKEFNFKDILVWR